ncbi:MAG TPA: hypothetical protein VFE05_11780 [Longimicrobiaceae bacterium]|jgi:hypothetical protein|nr:hypothetical protein [Longimicrobiaceae bacterium]
MNQVKLDIDALTVDTFATTPATAAPAVITTPGGFCCTGCDSGCGIFYTAGCENSGTKTTTGDDSVFICAA